MSERLDEVEARRQVAAAERIVIKIGSSLLSDPETGLSHDNITRWCRDIVGLMNKGKQVLLVSSGAVAEGVARLGWNPRPTDLPRLQAAAAVGQMGLVQAYETAFAEHARHTAIVLLTHEDLADRQRYLNARSTLTHLLDLGVVPIVNENDTVATEEIRFGDNDTLAALVTNLLAADLLIVLTDVDGIYDADPRTSPAAQRIAFAEAIDPALDKVAGQVGALGRGGMVTKIGAARMAARSGAHTIIADGRQSHALTEILEGRQIGTLLAATVHPLDARKRWIVGLKPKGTLVLDAGAAQALRERGVSLLPVGVVSIVGDFVRGDVVRCVSEDGTVIAQGLVNYASPEVEKLFGVASERIGERLGYAVEPELVHRDNLVVV
ncbi:MAG: glutamate 5-kinase [Gammaproteobacteria bacterium]|nr:glutamate 5-kinase [Gammaproteobacteria bacterium]